MAENEFNPNDPEFYYRRGGDYRDKRDYDKALADYNEAIRLDPKRSIYYSGRGGVYQSKGNYDKALADFDEAIRLNPDLPTQYEFRGDLYTVKGDYDKAIADFDKAIRRRQLEPFADEPDAHPYIGRGVAYASKGDYDKAIADWEAALKIIPDHPEIKAMIALVQKQRAKGGVLTFPGPNLLPMAYVQMIKKGLIANFVFMGIGVVIGVIIGAALGNPFLVIILGGFFGTLKSTLSKLIALVKQSAGGGEAIISLVLSLLIAPVWFVIKLVKRLKAFFWARSIEKALSKEIEPSGINAIIGLGDYYDTTI